MGSKDNISLGFSITIACLVTIPIIFLIGLTISGIWELSGSIFFLLISLGFYIPSFILYIIGTASNKSNLVKMGFGLGLSSWILGLFNLYLTSIDISFYRGFAVPIEKFLFLLLDPEHNLPFFLYDLIFNRPPISAVIPISAILYLISTIICIIFGSIIFVRRKYL